MVDKNSYCNLNSSITTVSTTLNNFKSRIINNIGNGHNIVFVKRVPYSEIDQTHVTETYLKAWYAWFVRNHPNMGFTIFIGMNHPNSAGLWIGFVYGTDSASIKNGVIRYCEGISLGLNNMYIAGYNDAVWHYRAVTLST